MELRGFDSYQITLGDEMRGERASLGKALEDVERDLRIKKRMIVAIENCDLEGFPNRSVVVGYVRSYARYLGMDPEDCYRRFCAESGYQSPLAMMAQQSARSARLPLLPAGVVGPEIAYSRFAAPVARSRFLVPVSLGAVTSSAALLALMAGLGYGGYALLQDIQRVGFAPIPQAPAVVAQAPLIATPEIASDVIPLPEARDYRDGGLLAAVAAPASLQSIETLGRDGPISAIDPQLAGLFAPGPAEPADRARTLPLVDSVEDAIRLIQNERQQSLVAADRPQSVKATAGTMMASVSAANLAGMTIGDAGGDADDFAADPMATAPGGITLHASEKAWIRVREHDNVIFEGILDAGERYELPSRVDAPVLKAGNAGGVFIVVDGVPYGPLGGRGQIARNVSLLARDVRTSVPQAASLGIAAIRPAETQQHAEADTGRR